MSACICACATVSYSTHCEHSNGWSIVCLSLFLQLSHDEYLNIIMSHGNIGLDTHELPRSLLFLCQIVVVIYVCTTFLPFLSHWNVYIDKIWKKNFVQFYHFDCTQYSCHIQLRACIHQVEENMRARVSVIVVFCIFKQSSCYLYTRTCALLSLFRLNERLESRVGIHCFIFALDFIFAALHLFITGFQSYASNSYFVIYLYFITIY